MNASDRMYTELTLLSFFVNNTNHILMYYDKIFRIALSVSSKSADSRAEVWRCLTDSTNHTYCPAIRPTKLHERTGNLSDPHGSMRLSSREERIRIYLLEQHASFGVTEWIRFSTA